MTIPSGSEQYRLPTIKLGSPGEDISKKELRAIIQRFKNLHLQQQARIQNFLQPHQRVFLSLLPLLFHQNTPLLPGFISTETPAGIADYKPSRQTLADAVQFSKNFSFKSRALRKYPIWALFLMGSVSSIAFSKSSDMDIWLCHQPGLSVEQRDELRQKATAIEHWAATLGLEVHFFLIDSERFKSGQDTPISTESSGTTQHYLLLEEFYRTAVYIAGRTLAWWLVPPQEDRRSGAYIRHLIGHRFIQEQELIDFGDLEAVPPEEFITVTLWHLYKALNSPHKSLLKLLLMECYASEYPDIQWLCADMKKIVYLGHFSLEQLDPYLLIQQKLETYLAQAQSTARLELARQSFYIKITGLENSEQNLQKKFWRVEFINNCARHWHWPESLLKSLSQQSSWNILLATREHELIIKHLSQCYRMIHGFAGRHVRAGYKSNEDLKLIGRKLHSFLEKRPGKVEPLTTQSILKTKEDELSLVETDFADNRSAWNLFIGHVGADNHLSHPPIKKSWSLLESLVWLVVNGLYHQKLKLHLDAKTLTFSDNEWRIIPRQIHDFIKTHKSFQTDSLEVYKSANKNLYSLVLINMGTAPEDNADKDKLVMSERSDPLSYGKNRQCFIKTLDCISLSSWGEITTQHLSGADGLFTFLTETLNNSSTSLPPVTPIFICNTSARAKSISQRIDAVFEALTTHLANADRNTSPRYILAGGADYFIFQRKNNTVHFWSIHGQSALLDELGAPQEYFSPTVIDPECVENNLFTALFKFNRINVIQVFFHIQQNTLQLYILDEKGSLFTRHTIQAQADALLNRYGRFLENIITRNFFDANIGIEYYQIRQNTLDIAPYTPAQPEIQLSRELTVRVSGEQIDHTSTYTLYCNENEFSSLIHGQQVINAAARYIMEFRQSRQNYPIHISDIDVPPITLGFGQTGAPQTIHFLKYKQKIEDRLNNAASSIAKEGGRKLAF
ncbi:MAG: adenylate cyclase [Gammaproteobacteria bacterium HGW-Gammaproteobacteria-3]|nr:MAG: adenylate cyclase [Gammaproteobacteria bacterium HGW-Gammaproteobacteria-3]